MKNCTYFKFICTIFHEKFSKFFLKDADVFLKHDDILTTPLRPVDNFLKYFHKTIPTNC